MPTFFYQHIRRKRRQNGARASFPPASLLPPRTKKISNLACSSCRESCVPLRFRDDDGVCPSASILRQGASDGETSCFVIDLDGMGRLLSDNGLRLRNDIGLPPRPLLITYATGCLDRARAPAPVPTIDESFRSTTGGLGAKVRNGLQFIITPFPISGVR